jgi:hypothetical protein
MIDSGEIDVSEARDDEIEQIVSSGPIGALTVAGIATALVVLMWVLFYALVFVPRGGVI